MVKQVWEYPTLTEVINQNRLSNQAVGLGIISGSIQAYQQQPLYWRRLTRDLAQEIGIIAENIIQQTTSPINLEALLNQLAELGSNISENRVYGIIKRNIKRGYDQTGLNSFSQQVFSLFDEEEGKNYLSELRQGTKPRYQQLIGSWLLKEEERLTEHLRKYFNCR